MLVAGTFRSDQGAPLRATWNAPKRRARASSARCDSGPADAGRRQHGRDRSRSQPGEVWGDRVNEIDLRFAKILRFGGTRTHIGIDIFNILNSDAILTYNQTFAPGGAWLGAAVGADAALREGERADRLLICWWPVPKQAAGPTTCLSHGPRPVLDAGLFVTGLPLPLRATMAHTSMSASRLAGARMLLSPREPLVAAAPPRPSSSSCSS